jgi:hypothetical protein
LSARIAVAVVLSAACGSRLAAQDAPVVDRWAIASELGLNAARGNSSYTMLTTGLRATHLNTKEFEFDWSSALTYGESNGTVIARRMQTALKGDWRPAGTWSPFVFASVERDRIRRVNTLSNAGAGAKWTWLRNARGTASLSAAALYAYKEILPANPPKPTDELVQHTARASLRPKIIQRFTSGFSVEHTTFWQPDIANTADYTIDAVTRLGYSPSKISTLFTQYTYRVDSRPPAGVKREDQLMVAGVKLQF